MNIADLLLNKNEAKEIENLHVHCSTERYDLSDETIIKIQKQAAYLESITNQPVSL